MFLDLIHTRRFVQWRMVLFSTAVFFTVLLLNTQILSVHAQISNQAFWINHISNGTNATGFVNTTSCPQFNPCDASTPEKFASLMNAIPADSIINFAAGTYDTYGLEEKDTIFSKSWWVKKGWKMHGAGKDITILRLVGLTQDGDGGYVVSGKAYNELTDNFELSGMTLDANGQGQVNQTRGTLGNNLGIVAQGISVRGNNVWLHDFRVKNIVTRNINREGFGIVPQGAHPEYGDTTNYVVENCVVDNPQSSVREVTLVAIGGIFNWLKTDGSVYNPSGKGPGMMINPVFRNCVVDGAGATNETHAITVWGSRGGAVELNTVKNVTYGFYVDTYRTESVTVRNNTFLDVERGLYLNLGGSHPAQFNKGGGVTFTNNTVRLAPDYRMHRADYYYNGGYLASDGFKAPDGQFLCGVCAGFGPDTPTGSIIVDNFIISGNTFNLISNIDTKVAVLGVDLHGVQDVSITNNQFNFPVPPTGYPAMDSLIAWSTSSTIPSANNTCTGNKDVNGSVLSCHPTPAPSTGLGVIMITPISLTTPPPDTMVNSISDTKGYQSINFDTISDKLTTDSIDLTTVARSVTSGTPNNLPLTFSVVSGPANIVGNTLTFSGAGSVTVRASQTGSTNYYMAAPVDRTFTVTKATIPAASITLNGLTGNTYTNSIKQVVATADPVVAGIDVTYAPVSPWWNIGGIFGKDGATAPVNAGSYTVTATINDSKYTGTKTDTLIIDKALQTITTNFPTAQIDLAKKVGDSIDLTATSPATGSVTYTLSGTGSGDISVINANTKRLTFTGEGQVTITASHGGDNNYLPAPSTPSNSVTFTVTRNTANVSVGGLLQVYTGNPRPVTVLTPLASVAPTIVTYDGSATAPTAVGTYRVVATVNSTTYAGQFIGTLTIQKANQTITFLPIADGKKAGESFVLSATSDSGLPVKFTVSNLGSIGPDGKTLTINGAGFVTVTATQAGDGNYTEAPSVTRTFSTIKNTATVGFDTTSLTQTYDGTEKSVTVTTPVGKNIIKSYRQINSFLGVFDSVSRSTTAPIRAGRYEVTGTIDDPASEGSATAELVINRKAQTLTTTNFSATPVSKFVNDQVILSAVSPATGNVSLSVTGPGSISGGTLTFNGEGSVTVTASHPGDTNYLPAPDAVAVFTVTKASATVRISNATFVYDGSSIPKTPVIVTEPLGLANTIVYTPATAGRINAGVYPFTATLTGSAYNGTVSSNLEITKAAQTITFGEIASGKNIGDHFDLDVTSNSPNQVQLAMTTVPTGIASLSGKTLTITGAGTITITASQAATVNYTKASDVVKTIIIPKTATSISIQYPDTAFTGNAKPITYTINPPVPSGNVSVTYNGSSALPLNVGSYDVSVVITDPNYSGSASGSFVIQKASQPVNFAPMMSRKVGEKETLSVSGATGPVTFAVVGPAPADLNTMTNEIAYTTPGTVHIRATIAETTNYSGAIIDKEVTVTPAVVLGGGLVIVDNHTDAIVSSPHESKIKWNTNTQATSEVFYAPTAQWTTVAARQHQVIATGTRTVHEVALSNLRPRTEYTYKAISKDTQGNQAVNDPIFTTPDEPHTITTGTSGVGAGAITLFPMGTSCGVNCQQYPYGTQVTITATPNAAATLLSVSGCAVVNSNSCILTLDQNYTIAAVFGIAPVTTTTTTTGTSPAGTSSDFSGWAWSSNIGWISFNAANTDSLGGTYKVSLDNTTHEFSGYAWSQNVGWITFNKNELVGCPSGECVAKLVGDSLSGWARACNSMFQFSCGVNALTTIETSALGGWDGWISLDTKVSGTISYGPKIVNNQLTGSAWGDKIFGWISFDWLNQLRNPVKPNVTVILSDTVVQVNGKTNITWQVTDADTCVASGGWTDNKSKDGGTEQSGNITANTTFFLDCTGPGGQTSASASIGVTATPPSPLIVINASPTTVASGSNTALTWRVNNATSCTASNNASNTEWTGSVTIPSDFLTSASKIIHSLTRNTQFTLTCSSGTLTTSESVMVVVTTLPIPPSVLLTSPSNDAQFIQNSTVVLTAVASDSDGTISSVTFYDNGSLIPNSIVTAPITTTIDGSTYSYSYQPTVGQHIFKAVATDNSNLSTDSGTVSVTVNPLHPPVVSLTTSKAQITLGESVILTANASDSDGTIDHVEFWDGSNQIGTADTAPYTYTYTPTTSGTHQLKAHAIDNNSLGADSADVTLAVSDGVVVVKYPPTVSLTAPLSNAQFTQNTNVILTATASDSDGTVSRVEFYDGATLIGTDTSAPYTFTYVGPSIGGHSLKAKAWDNDSQSAESADVPITVHAFLAPSVMLTAPVDGTQMTLGDSITLSATTTKGDGAISNVTFFDGSTVIKLDTTTPYPNPYLYTYTPTTIGTHQLKAQVTDTNGFVITSSTVEVTVSSLPLAPQVDLSVDKATVTSGQSATLSWKVSDATTCTASSNPANSQWNGSKAVPVDANTTLTQTITNITVATQFTLSCTGAGGTTVTNANVDVTSKPVAPNIILNVTIPEGSAYGLAGQTALISWTAYNAYSTGCIASGSWDGAKANSGLNEVSPELFVPEATYQLTCSGPGGTRSQEVTIEVRGGSRYVRPTDPCANGQVCLKTPDVPTPITTEDIDLYASSGIEGVTDYGKGFKGGLLTIKSTEAYTIKWETAASIDSAWTCAATSNGPGVTNEFLNNADGTAKSASDLASINWKTGSLADLNFKNTTGVPIIKTYSITCTKNAGVTGLFKSLWQLASVGTLAQATTPATVSDSISVQINPEGVPAVSNPVDVAGNCLYLNTVTPTTVAKNASKNFYKKNLVTSISGYPNQACNAEAQSFTCHADEVSKNGTPIPSYFDPDQNSYKQYKYASCQESSIEEF